ncbi:MAG TPA: FecR domain-containing protein [Mucilaginibacter sp.]|jgi:ferric-dicitrate binding protein FerR (iron transport regulator)
MSRIDIEYLLDRYLKGEASAEEIYSVETWLDQTGNPGSEWQQMDKTTRDQWLAGVFNEIEASAGINGSKVIMMRQRRILWRSIAAVAAVLAIFFTIYLERPTLQNVSPAGQLISLTVPINQKKQVILADGSKIWVNSLSQLKYPEEFYGKTREVYLSGEAYFDVQHDASRPFIIHTGKLVTTVLGTAFNIKEDNLRHTVIVTVTRGKVSVANGDQPLGIITPNQQISFNVVSHQHVQKDINAKNVTVWLDRDIHFENITFAEAAMQLERRFKVKISFANDKVKSCRFTGSVLKEDRLDKMLKVICAFNNATYRTKADGSIVIDGQGCN